MKKYGICLLCLVLLTGCASQETFETILDDLAEPAAVEVRDIVVALPEGMATPTAQADGSTLYQGEGFEIMLQTFPGGDKNATMETLCGYSQEDLTVMQTQEGELQKYEFVWVSAGEMGDRIGRALILDDGYHHYSVSVLSDADRTGELEAVLDVLFQSVMLS